MSDTNLKRSRTESVKKVLVVNANPDLSEALDFLRHQRQKFHFFQEHAAADTREGTELNIFDLAIVDTSVNGKNGKNVVDQIKTKYGNIKIYSREKTVCDMFRYRNKLGDDIAIEGLKSYLEYKHADLNKLKEYAEICQVKLVMTPYIKAMVV